MSDAYGSITFKKSNGCSFDCSQLAEELNSFNWSNDGAKWLVNEESDSLHLDSRNPQYPLAIPEFEEFIHIRNEDGSWTTFEASEVNEDDLLEMYGSTNSPYPLKTLSQRISPLVREGWIEIACVANEKARYAYFQLLRIYSDGRAKKINTRSGPTVDSVNEQESYEPTAY